MDTRILIQSTNIIEGIEMEALRQVENMESSFKDIRGKSTPLHRRRLRESGFYSGKTIFRKGCGCTSRSWNLYTSYRDLLHVGVYVKG